jgi:hypothetical protein
MSTDFTLSGQTEVRIEDLPYKWVPMMNFFDSDVPGFPLHRVHVKSGSTRLFGAPMTKTVHERNDDGTCTLGIDVITNQPLEDVPSDVRDEFEQELKERFGFAEALSVDDLYDCCQYPDGTVDDHHETWETMIDLIFPRLERYFGNKLRCGRFYPKSYGLFRLVSTFNVPGGEKQEIIMTSNLLKTVGKRVDSEEDEAINLQIVPTYDEILNEELDGFPDFQRLKDAVEDYGDQYLTKEYSIEDSTVYLLGEDYKTPMRAGWWGNQMESVEPENREVLVQLKEDLNRNYMRPFILIVYLYNVFQGLDFGDLTRADYAEIYRSEPRSMYPKVLGMVLQQAFGNYECIPVDTWVETFFKIVLDVDKNDIPVSGSELGKFERFVWEISQLRKTNQPLFSDIVHCIKTGVMYADDDMVMRDANPLSCNLCSLSEEGCPKYESVADSQVAVIERSRFVQDGAIDTVKFETVDRKVSDEHGELHLDIDEFDDRGSVEHVIITIDGDALASYSRRDNKWERTDDMSPFTTQMPLDEGVYSMRSIVEDS